jgi:hypothetical protein
LLKWVQSDVDRLSNGRKEQHPDEIGSSYLPLSDMGIERDQRPNDEVQQQSSSAIAPRS